jgi:drug/metabolite transporter (DMT)-like permease
MASRYILKERISLRRWAGIGTIVVGVVLVTGQQLG